MLGLLTGALLAVFSSMAHTGTAAHIGVREPPPAAVQPNITQYSVHDLQQMNYSLKVSNDTDVDICKAAGFYGDIAQPMFAHPYIQHYFYQPSPTGSASTTPVPAAAASPDLNTPNAPKLATKTRSRRRSTKSAKRRRRQRRRGKSSRRNGRKLLSARAKLVSKSKWRRSIVESITIQGGHSSRSLQIDTETETIMRQSERNSDNRRRRRAAIAMRDNLWEHAVIPYEIESNFTGEQRALFKQAMRHWENHTCIRFIERDSAGTCNRQLGHDNYVLFTVRPCGCCSYVGRRGNGPQAISIGRNCDTFGVVVHEIGHAVGFFHEHTRPDRDQHVRVLTENIAYGRRNNFQRMPADQVNSLGQPYDYASIMHYADNQLSRAPGLQTLKVLDDTAAQRIGAPQIGQRRALSAGDIVQANLLYRCAVCGQTLLESSGTLRVPMAGGGKPLACEWRIAATPGESIVLRVVGLYVVGGDCELNYVEVRDGYWSGSPVIGRLCGGGDVSGLPTEELQSTGNRMLITLRTQAIAAKATQPPFVATYETICGGDLFVNETSGRIESPNYPSDYLPGRECVWRLRVPAASQVAVQFQSFDVEAHDECAFDALEMRDGSDAAAPLLGRFCGFRLPATVHSTGSHMWVRFRSDKSTQRTGFSATIVRERDECALGEHRCEHRCVNTAGAYRCTCADGYDLHSNRRTCETACGRVIELAEAATGTIVSPSFPDLYPSGKLCVWEIRAPPARRVTLSFTHFDLEDYAFQTRDCEADWLAIDSLDADGAVDRTHGVHCGSRRLDAVLASTGRLRLVFRSDRTIQKGGFALIYGLDVDECAAAANNGGCMHRCRNTLGSFECACDEGTVLDANGLDCVQQGADCRYKIAAPTGRVTSPGWPLAYPPNAHCSWHFRTVAGHRVQFQFERFDVEPAHEECDYDRVAFFDGASTDAFALGVFCGRRNWLPAVQSTGGDLVMEFYSDASGQRTGFAGRHSTVCGGRFVAGDRLLRIYSHVAYGREAYAGRHNCEWMLMAPEYGQMVRVSFEEFEVGFGGGGFQEGDCASAYVEMIDGENDFDGEHRGRYCGSVLPPTLVSSAEVLVVRFRADAEPGSRGFVLSYVAVEAPGSSARNFM